MSIVETLFTSEDKHEIKEALKQVIVNQFMKDLEDSDTYLMGNLDIEDWVAESLEEIEDEVKHEFKNAFRNKFEEKLKKIEEEL